MSISPRLYAQIGEALFNKVWVYEMRALLDIGKAEAEQIAYHGARGLPYPIPRGVEGPLKAALEAKLEQVQEALRALEAQP